MYQQLSDQAFIEHRRLSQDIAPKAKAFSATEGDAENIGTHLARILAASLIQSYTS